MRRVLAAVVALVVLTASMARAADVPPNATWSEAYFSSGDGTMLHADVIRPANLGPTDRTPVILTVGPYFNHAGNIPSYQATSTGPPDTYDDLVQGGKLFTRGYSYVTVDLRGTGGSDGCTDFGGPGEQADVKAAVEWAASQPWSTGRVGMYGISYDGWTGLMGIAQQPKGLAAVVAMEPVYDGYRYLYTNGVRFSRSVLTPAAFTEIDASPPSTRDSSQYQENNVQKTPWCYATNIGLQQQNDPNASFWQDRALTPRVAGLRTPLLLSQGFIETNTQPDGAFAFFNALAGPKRAWLGEWDHTRPNAANNGTTISGREGWIDEVMRFYNEYLKDIQPAVSDPSVVVEDGLGHWRGEPRWPPADAAPYVTALRTGSYLDDAANNGTAAQPTTGAKVPGASTGNGIWSFSAPLDRTVQLSGISRMTVDAEVTLPNANLVADVYDVSPEGSALLITRGAQLLGSSGTYGFDLYGQDWPVSAGHRIGVLITGSNDEWWVHVPTRQTVTVSHAEISLPFLAAPASPDLAGASSTFLKQYRNLAPFTVSTATIGGATVPFALPPDDKEQ